MTHSKPGAASAFVLLVLAGLGLGGCRGSVSTDLSADAPANPQIVGINVGVLGVEFQRSDATAAKIEFTTAEPADLITLLEDNSFRLFTDEELTEGSYTGVRLLLEDNDDASVVLTDGTEFPLRLTEGSYAAVDFTVDEDRSSNRSLVLTLDLRKSLSFNEDGREYALTPTLRAVDAADAGQIRGNVDITCPAGTSPQTGGAVYAFAGEDIEPVEIDGIDTEPYATTAMLSSFGGPLTYALRALPPGDYTIALTCNGNDDTPAAGDDIQFQRAVNVSVDGDAITYNFTN
ncbi:DUF4382 domain-containing protein [Povalibacter sp.]|uniref:DUF4382 domain-containing protein n=1 Tax=Povalibacter sp. TaxID=1962978 RepID=UPI002F41C702